MRPKHAVGSEYDPKNIALVSNTRGVCLTELLLGLATGVIVLAAALDTFTIVQARVTQQQSALAHQQDLRLGLEVFAQEVRLAAPESIVAAHSDEVQFFANISGHRTTTTGAVMPGQTVLAVRDGSGWGNGKTVMLCGPQVCETHHLSRAGQRYQLALTEPIGQMFPAGVSVEVRNQLVYYVKSGEKGLLRIMRMVDGGASTLIGGLKSVQFSYRDERGDATSDPSRVKRVVVDLETSHTSRKIVKDVSLRS